MSSSLLLHLSGEWEEGVPSRKLGRGDIAVSWNQLLWVPRAWPGYRQGNGDAGQTLALWGTQAVPVGPLSELLLENSQPGTYMYSQVLIIGPHRPPKLLGWKIHIHSPLLLPADALGDTL